MSCFRGKPKSVDVVEVDMQIDTRLKAERSRLDIQWAQLAEAQHKMDVERRKLETLRTELENERLQLEIDREAVDAIREKNRGEADGWGVNRDRDSLQESMRRGRSGVTKDSRRTFTKGEVAGAAATPEQTRRQGKRFSSVGDSSEEQPKSVWRRGSLIAFAKDAAIAAKKSTRRGSLFAHANTSPDLTKRDAL